MTSFHSVLQLEQHRKQAGVSLESIAESTKITTRFLRAIECEEFEKLPGGVFDTNYIRQYAEAIGFPTERILAAYQLRKEALEPPDPLPAPRESSRLRSLINWLVAPATNERF